MNILLGMTGSVATIKGSELVDELSKIGSVKVVQTESATKFNTITINQAEIFRDHHEWRWEKLGDPVLHIQLRDWYDVFVIAPASANTIGKMANGICDNLLTTIWMASRNKKVIIAPAMNTQMWKHPIVENNIRTLKTLDVQIIPPITKNLACGEAGIGAMAHINEIVSNVKLSIG